MKEETNQEYINRKYLNKDKVYCNWAGIEFYMNKSLNKFLFWTFVIGFLIWVLYLAGHPDIGYSESRYS